MKKPPALDHIAPAWFHERWKSLCDYVEEQIRLATPISGIGIDVTDSPAGKLVSRTVKNSPNLTPFRPYLASAEGTNGNYTKLVVGIKLGTILLSERWDDFAEISNPDATFELTGRGQGIWIKMTVPASGEPSEITFDLEGGELWGEYPKAFVHTGEEGDDPEDSAEDHSQTWWQLLVKVESATENTSYIRLGGESLVISQKTSTNLILRQDICAMQDGDKKNTMQLWPWHAACLPDFVE